MLSGAFSNTTDLKKTIRKVVKYILLFFFISTLYGIVDIIYSQRITSIADVLEYDFIKLLAEEIIQYKYHLWFLPAYTFVLLIMPIINSCCMQAEELLKYMSFIFGIYIIIQTANLFLQGDSLPYKFLNLIPFVGSYVGYFIWGKFLFRTELSIRQRGLIYVLGGISIFLIFILTRSISIEGGATNEKYYNHYTLFVFLSATLYFVLFKNLKISNRLERLVNFVAPHTLNVYLLHVFIIDFFTKVLDYKACSILPVVGVPLKVILVFGISLVLSLGVAFSTIVLKNMLAYKGNY